MTTTATRTIRIIVDSGNSQRNVDQINDRLNQTTQNTNRASFATNKLAAAIASVVSVYAALNAVKAIANLGDDYAKITGLLRNATSTQEEFNAALELSKKVAEETRASLGGTVDTFAMLERATRGSGRSTAELFNIIETINKSIALTSPNAESAAAALTQFGQALGTDFKNGSQELNSILEQAPGLAESMAAGLKIPVAELKTMAEQGELTRERVLDALNSMSNDVDEKFGKIPKTVSSTLQLIKNDLLVTFGENEVAAPLVSSLEDLRDTLNDPAVKSGLITLSSALVTLTGWLATAATKFAELGTNIGYFFAKITGQVSEADVLERKIKNLDSALSGGFISKLNEAFAFRNEQETKALRDNFVKQKQAIEDGITGISQAEREAMDRRAKMLDGIKVESPTFAPTAAPDLSSSTTKLVFEQDEDLAKQHYQNMRDIESQFWDAVKNESLGLDSIANAKKTTEAMRAELETRLQVSQFYRDAEGVGEEGSYQRQIALLNASRQEKTAVEQQRYTEEVALRNERQAEEIENLIGNLDAQKAIRDQYRQQEELALKIHTQTKEAIEQEAARRREALDKAEAERKRAYMFDTASAGVALLQAFGSQSEKSQKRFAKIGIAVDTASGIAKGVALGWPLGIPAVAWAIANGKMALNRLESASGGDGGSASIPTSSTLPTTVSQSSGETFKQKQVIEIRGIDKDSLITGEQLVDIMKTNDNVIVALSGAQADAQRRGVI